MASPSPLKRRHESVEGIASLAPVRDEDSKTKRSETPDKLDDSDMDTEEALVPTTAATAAVDESMVHPSVGSSTVPPGSGPPTKKRKLTAVEKAELQAQKDAEVQRKAEDKARKDDEKREKEEQKKQKLVEREEARKEKEEKRKAKEAEKAEKDAEKEEKRKAKEAEKAEKDAEKKAREEEKAKKERAQLRLNAFFKKPAAAATPDSAPSSRRGSVSSVEGAPNGSRAGSEPRQQPVSEYERAFRPFFLHAHTTLAPAIRHPMDEEQIQWAMDNITTGYQQASWSGTARNRILTETFRKRKRNSYMKHATVKEMMADIHGTSSDPIDLTSSEDARVRSASKRLRTLSVKYLKFAEDVRPPWMGTWSRAPEQRGFASLCRNPFRRALPEVNYDYDSEAEWVEPEDGEYLNSDEEESDEDDEEDMEGFLDDEGVEGTAPKRKQVIGDMEPVYTSLNWAGPDSSRQVKMVGYGKSTLDLSSYRLDTLLATEITLPIDPFSTAYWCPSASDEGAKGAEGDTAGGRMKAPSRTPLNTLKGPNQIFPPKSSSGEANAKATKLAAAKPMPPELMSDFKKAIEGSKLSKIGLIEVLKKDFPQITKKTAEQTLLQVARRVGKKEAEKTWQLMEA